MPQCSRVYQAVTRRRRCFVQSFEFMSAADGKYNEMAGSLACCCRYAHINRHNSGRNLSEVRLDVFDGEHFVSQLFFPHCPQYWFQWRCILYVLGPVPEVDVMAKRPQGLLNVGTLSARMAVLRSCALDI